MTDLLGLDIWYGHTPVRVVDNWYNNSGLLVPEFNRDVHTYQMEVEHDTGRGEEGGADTPTIYTWANLNMKYSIRFL